MRGRVLPLVLLVVVGSTSCRHEPSSVRPAPRVAVFQDGEMPDARAVVSPGVLGVQAGLGGALGVEIVEIAGASPTAVADDARAAVTDPSVVAAVIAPFTALPDAATSVLRSGGLPILSLSTSSSPGPDAGAPWRSFTSTIAADAAAIVARAGALGASDAALCVAGAGDGAWSAALADAIVRTAARGGMRAQRLEGSAGEVAAAGGDRGCAVLVWTGTGRGAATLWHTMPRGPVLLLADRARTPGFLEQVGPIAGAGLDGVCACADVSTSASPSAQRFLHDYQAATGLDPGPFAVEGWDLGRFLAGVVRGTPDRSRTGVAAGVGAAAGADGVAGGYRWDASGALASPRVRAYRGVGWRWLWLIVPPGASGGRPASSPGGQS